MNLDGTGREVLLQDKPPELRIVKPYGLAIYNGYDCSIKVSECLST